MVCYQSRPNEAEYHKAASSQDQANEIDGCVTVASARSLLLASEGSVLVGGDTECAREDGTSWYGVAMARLHDGAYFQSRMDSLHGAD